MSQFGNQRGMSLVELMVAMVLGLIVMGGIVAIFVGASGSFGMGRELDRSQENLRFAVSVLLPEFRHATRILESPTGPAWAPIEAEPHQTEGSQVITVRYPVVASGDAFHCDGDPVTAGEVLEKRFWVDLVERRGQIQGILRCRSGEGLGSVMVNEAGADEDSVVDLAIGIRRIGIAEWIVSDLAPEEYSLQAKTALGIEDEEGLGLVGIRFFIEHDHMRGQSRTFVITAALRNVVLQWFTVAPST